MSAAVNYPAFISSLSENTCVYRNNYSKEYAQEDEKLSDEWRNNIIKGIALGILGLGATAAIATGIGLAGLATPLTAALVTAVCLIGTTAACCVFAKFINACDHNYSEYKRINKRLTEKFTRQWNRDQIKHGKKNHVQFENNDKNTSDQYTARLINTPNCLNIVAKGAAEAKDAAAFTTELLVLQEEFSKEYDKQYTDFSKQYETYNIYGAMSCITAIAVSIFAIVVVSTSGLSSGLLATGLIVVIIGGCGSSIILPILCASKADRVYNKREQLPSALENDYQAKIWQIRHSAHTTANNTPVLQIEGSPPTAPPVPSAPPLNT